MKKMLIFVLCFFYTMNLIAKECFEMGESFRLPQNIYPDHLNKDKTLMIVDSGNSDTFSVYDIKTHQMKEFKKPLQSYIQWTKDNKLVITTSSGEEYKENSTAAEEIAQAKKMKVTLLDPKTGSRKELTGKYFSDGQFYSDLRTEGKDVILSKGENGKIMKHKIDHTLPSTTSLAYFGANGNSTIAYYNNEKKSLVIKKNGFQASDEKLDIGREFEQAIFTPDGKTLVMKLKPENGASPYADKNDFLIYDIAKKEKRLFSISKTYNLDFATVSPDSKSLSFSDNSGVKIFDLKTGISKTVSKDQIYNPKYDGNKKICGLLTPQMPGATATPYGVGYGMNGGYGGYTYTTGGYGIPSTSAVTPPLDYICVSAETGETLSKIPLVGVSPYDLLYTYVIPLPNNEFVVTRNIFSSNESKQITSHMIPKQMCTEAAKVVQCNCEIKLTGEINLDLPDLKKIVLKTACSKKYDPKDWEGLTNKSSGTIDEGSALVWMKQLSKPGAFQSSTDLSILLGMIESKMYQKYPSEFKGMLNGVLSTSEQLYKSLYEKYPQIRNISAASSASTCLTEDEHKQVQKKINAYIEKSILEKSPITNADLEPLIALAKDLDKDQKEALSEKMTEALVISISETPELKGIFPSKIYKFVINNILKKMDMPYKNLTDVTIIRNGDEIKFVTLGVEPFNLNTSSESRLTAGGFHLSTGESLSQSMLPKGTTVKNLSWDYNGTRYNAVVNLMKEDIMGKSIAPASLSPNYEEMWKGKTLRGLIIAGSNLGTQLTEDVMQQYLEYYIEKGFTFEKEPKKIANLNEYIKSKISGEEPAHYFVKEAHSDGDEKNLFRITKDGKLLQGIKKTGDKTEIVDIVYPGTSDETVLLDNNEFGKWIKEREKKKGPELVYINSSCWSAHKAIYEISAAQSPKLINIPSTTMMDTFTNEDDSVIKLTIDGIRQKKSYAEIREDLKKDKGYAERKENVLIFPDETEYETNVRKYVKEPVEIDTKIFKESTDGKNAPYSIENIH